MTTDKDAREIGPFRVLRRLRGSSRDVFLAENKERGRVVLKVFGAPPRNQGLFDPQIADASSFYARLSHPNIVKVVDLFSTDGQFVIALEYVDGSTLNVIGASLEKAKLELDDVCCLYIGSCIFSALAAAHEATDAAGKPAPLLHRNVNPSNVHVAWDGAIKLGNFNVAPMIRVLRDSSPGITWGSYGYFAPEQVRLEPLDTRTDVYSAMVIVWELLARKKAVQRGKLQDFEILKAMASPSFESLDTLRPQLDPRVRAIVRRGLAIDPRERPTAAAAAAALRSAIDVEDPRALLVKSLARPRVPPPPKEEPPSVHEAITVPPPSSEELVFESLPPPPLVPIEQRPKPPPLPPRASMASISTSRAFPPPPSPVLADAPTPHPLAVDVEAEPPQSPPIVLVRRRNARSIAAASIAVVVGVSAVLIGVRFVRRPSQAPAAPIVETAVPSPPPADTTPSVVAPIVSVQAAPAIPSDLGELVLPASAAGHRIFADGRVVGDGSKPIRIPCGRHIVRIGSGGRAKTVDVPCGGSMDL